MDSFDRTDLVGTIVVGIVILVGIVAGVAVVRTLARARSGGPAIESAADEPSPDATSRVAALVEPLRKPAVLVRATDMESTSHFGGLPPDHPGFVWPHKDGRPLDFLACIDLAALGGTLDWLPDRGLLLFFYDIEKQPWGFDPADVGSWAVRYVRDASALEGTVDAPEGLDGEREVPRTSVRFELASLPPSWEEDEVQELELSDEDSDALDELRSSLYGESPHHQMGGYADAIQNAGMELECQLASHGINLGGETGHDDPRAKEFAPGAGDWRLLLQVDSDDDLGLMWGDAGMLYFWVRADEARAGDFGNVWLVLQCY